MRTDPRARWLQNERKLAQLDPKYMERFEMVVKRMESSGWCPFVVETRRSLARQALLRARGFSRVLKGKHQLGHAMDIISNYHPWPKTPLAFMVELAFAAREEGLTTGLFWEMNKNDRAYLEMFLIKGTREELLRTLTRTGHGFDPCHVEVPSK